MGIDAEARERYGIVKQILKPAFVYFRVAHEMRQRGWRKSAVRAVREGRKLTDYVGATLMDASRR